MAEKNYTPEEMADAERFAQIMANVPKERKPLVTMMASAFIAGVEAQAHLAEPDGAAS